jgi:hypothetical protein
MAGVDLVVVAVGIAIFASFFMPLLWGATGEGPNNMPISGFIGFLLVGLVASVVGTGLSEFGFLFIGVIVVVAVIMLTNSFNS